MTRRIVFLLLIFAFSVSVSASDRQERRAQWREQNPNLFSANFGISGYPAAYNIYCGGLSKTVFNFNYYDVLAPFEPLADIYEDSYGKTWTVGTVGGEFNYNCSRWFNASAYLGFCPVWGTVTDGYTGEVKRNNFALAIYLMPKVKLMYANDPTVRVYSSLALGAVFLPGFKQASSSVKPAIQFNLLGVEIGRKWFGFFEIGAGTVFIGGQAGFGFKF